MESFRLHDFKDVNSQVAELSQETQDKDNDERKPGLINRRKVELLMEKKDSSKSISSLSLFCIEKMKNDLLRDFLCI